MSMLASKQDMVFVQKQPGFEIKPHPEHSRLYHIELDDSLLQTFFAGLSEVNAQTLEYVPYMRLILAGRLSDLFGASLGEAVRGILHDRRSGGFTVGVQEQAMDPESYVKFGTAVSCLAGTPNFDAMSGTYYARFTVKDTDDSDSYLRQAYRLFTLHTDGTFVEEPTDWLLMMKFEERHSAGGESRILHLDDWEELKKFSDHPLASYPFTYKSPPSKNIGQVVKRKTFFKQNNGTCICFIDQFVYPETIAQAAYLKELSESLENSAAVMALPLPAGQLIMLNNTFWMHGRAAFEKHPELHRELMRLRGVFTEV
ncbi:glutarate dioxygenase GlaH [Paenibacillus piri]|uniref:Carbon starvation induced protein CsiD n=1 Tax=Paenibacillus piri TaxID=2547395 RepID=A0A4V2ZUD7_9BACL|nr:glutarate dioxygenase GlaH [Paenibacillus piri]TDG00365.1 carbon starvation induced protein CsiD [Paenibacillus piri]